VGHKQYITSALISVTISACASVNAWDVTQDWNYLDSTNSGEFSRQKLTDDIEWKRITSNSNCYDRNGDSVSTVNCDEVKTQLTSLKAGLRDLRIASQEELGHNACFDMTSDHLGSAETLEMAKKCLSIREKQLTALKKFQIEANKLTDFFKKQLPNTTAEITRIAETQSDLEKSISEASTVIQSSLKEIADSVAELKKMKSFSKTITQKHGINTAELEREVVRSDNVEFNGFKFYQLLYLLDKTKKLDHVEYTVTNSKAGKLIRLKGASPITDAPIFIQFIITDQYVILSRVKIGDTDTTGGDAAVLMTGLIM